MSNELTTPAGGPAKIFGQHKEELDEPGSGVVTGLGVIGINGKTFYLRYRGNKHTLVNPPKDPPTEYDGLPTQSLDCVILRGYKVISHTWYKKGFQDDVRDKPDCVSTDGIAPDDASPDPQSDLCQMCEQRVWKRQPNGREGRACQDSIRLAILPEEYLTTAVLGEPVTEPVYFKIPAASMKGLNEFIDATKRKHGELAVPTSYVVRIWFDPKFQYPKFLYRVLRWLPEAEAAHMLELRNHPQALRIVGLKPDGTSLVRSQQIAPGLTRLAPRPAPGQLEKPKVDLELEAVKEPPPTEAPKASFEDADPSVDAVIANMRPRAG